MRTECLLSPQHSLLSPELRRVVVEIRTQPPLHGPQVHLFSQMIINDLIAAELADRKIFRGGMRKIESADRAGRIHGKILGQADTRVFLHLQEIKQRLFFSMVRAGWIPWRRANATISLLD